MTFRSMMSSHLGGHIYGEKMDKMVDGGDGMLLIR